MADEEKPGPSPLGTLGSQGLGRDEFFGERARHWRDSPLGLGGRVPASMAPRVRSTMSRSPMGMQTKVNPWARAAEQKKTLKEMEEQQSMHRLDQERKIADLKLETTTRIVALEMSVSPDKT